MNWKLVKDLNVQPEGIKFLEKSTGTHYLTQIGAISLLIHLLEEWK